MSEPRPESFASRVALPALLVLAAALAWANSFSGPFVFDDRPAILANRTLDSFSTAWSPPRDGGTVAGRPLVNLSLALNHALTGEDVWSYHAFNLLVHVLAGLTLFGLVRRTLPGRGETVAFSAALLWLVHPLQTAAVTYVVQRAEALMALCFLLTLYAFVRSLEPGRAGWRVVSVLACLAGIAAKEVMVAAPLVVLLYDRTFVAGSVAAALRQRGRYYAALAATWILLGWLVASNAGRAGTAGFGTSIAPLDYALTQCGALVRYAWLACWPRALEFDYGTRVVLSWTEVGRQMLLVAVVVVIVVVAWWRRSAAGFLGLAGLLVLAPSSSVLPVATQTVAEHRVYLPLAAVAVAVAAALHALGGRRAILVTVGLAVALAGLTARRNEDYRTAVALWSDTVRKRPDNPRARVHLGNALVFAGRRGEAVAQYQEALSYAPDDPEAHHNLANILMATGRPAEALPHLAAAIRGRPQVVSSRLSYARALATLGRTGEAIEQYEAAARLEPLNADGEGGWGAALAAAGRLDDAIAHDQNALRLRPDDAQVHYNLGLAFARSRRLAEAIEHFETAVRLEPENVPARVNLGNALLVTGRTAEAISAYEAALRLRPDDPQIRANLARARAVR